MSDNTLLPEFTVISGGSGGGGGGGSGGWGTPGGGGGSGGGFTPHFTTPTPRPAPTPAPAPPRAAPPPPPDSTPTMEAAIVEADRPAKVPIKTLIASTLVLAAPETGGASLVALGIFGLGLGAAALYDYYKRHQYDTKTPPLAPPDTGPTDPPGIQTNPFVTETPPTLPEAIVVGRTPPTLPELIVLGTPQLLPDRFVNAAMLSAQAAPSAPRSPSRGRAPSRSATAPSTRAPAVRTRRTPLERAPPRVLSPVDVSALPQPGVRPHPAQPPRVIPVAPPSTTTPPRTGTNNPPRTGDTTAPIDIAPPIIGPPPPPAIFNPPQTGVISVPQINPIAVPVPALNLDLQTAQAPVLAFTRARRRAAEAEQECPDKKGKKKRTQCRQGYFRETKDGVNYTTWSTRKCP